jgi:hypothetical protein
VNHAVQHKFIGIDARAHNVPPLRNALKHCCANQFIDRVWMCKPAGIADYCPAMKPGVIPGGFLLTPDKENSHA